MSNTRIYDSRRVVILPTNNSNTDILLTGNGIYVHQERPTLVEDESYQFIYIISNEDVKIGDWIVNLYNHTDTYANIYQIKDISDIKIYDKSDEWFKVIASNNPELGLPDLTFNFIKNVINNFNENRVGEFALKAYFIKFNCNVDILFEYDDLYEFDLVLSNNKIISKLDTLKVPKIKLYNREEVVKFITDAFGEGFYNGLAHLGNGNKAKTLEEVIKESGV